MSYTPFEFLECFIRPANLVSLKGKTKKSDLIRRCNTAFILIDFEFESALKKSPNTAHHSFTRTLTLHQNDEIISVSDKFVTTLFQLLIKIIQKDIS